jgi:hypothetical protein
VCTDRYMTGHKQRYHLALASAELLAIEVPSPPSAAQRITRTLICRRHLSLPAVPPPSSHVHMKRTA